MKIFTTNFFVKFINIFIIKRNFTTFKKNIKFGVYRSLDNENSLENSKNVTISYNALNEKGLTQNEKSEIGSTSMLANETMSNSQIDISPNNSSSSSYNRRRSNFNDYNLEVVKKLEYCDSSKSIIKGSCVLNSKYYTFILYLYCFFFFFFFFFEKY